MKTAPAIEAALNTEHAVMALPELTVDWNMNRFIGAVADNTPSDQDEGFDIELFPIESIVQPLRPTKGINKLRIGQGTVGNDYNEVQDGVYNGQFYISDVDDIYKYWTSPYPSSTTGALASCLPQVVYNENITVNKIVITTENSWATAKNFSIQTTTSANPSSGDWTEIANQSIGNAWKASGRIILYWNGTSWIVGNRQDNIDGTPITTTIRGIRLSVTSLENGYQKSDTGSLVPSTYIDTTGGGAVTRTTDGRSAFFDLIEISARLEADLSKYIIEVGDTFDLGEVSALYPIGTITSNVADITLSNLYLDDDGDWVPGIFNAENTDSPYHKFIDANAEMTLRYTYYDEDGAPIDTIQQFKMYTDVWTGQGNEQVTVELSDYSKFLNLITLQPAMWEGLSVPQIVWRIMDSVGFVNYHIDMNSDRVTEHIIPVFYTNGEQSVWEVLDELSKASQTAIYFDSNDVLQVKTRDFALSAADEPVADLTSNSTVDQLANIAELEIDSQFEPNHYKVIYQKTNWQPVQRNPVNTMQQVWEPEDEEVLRATPLVRSLGTNDAFFFIGTDDVKLWPYEGIVNIGGELIKYKGKEFVYYTGPTGSVRNTKVIASQDEHNSKNSQTPVTQRHKNFYTGGLNVVERGLWNSENKSHAVDAIGYSTRFAGGSAGNFAHLKQESRVRLDTNMSATGVMVATRGAADDTPFFNYGTRFKFVAGAGKVDQRAGLLIHNSGGSEDGYYIELCPDSKIPNSEQLSRREIMLYKKSGSSFTSLVGAGRPAAIVEGVDYELDVEYRNVGGNHKIRVWVNGKEAFSVVVAGSDRQTPNGKFGVFARGGTRAEFEYLYAIRREEEPESPEDFSFLDKIDRAYTGNQWDREWVYRWREYKRRTKKGWRKERQRFNRQFFDDFGPYVHELRQYDIKFDPNPVLHSRPYLTNDWSAVILEYRADPFGANFIVANTSRRNAIVHGEDTTLSSSSGESLNQVLTIFGRALIVEDAQEVIAENSDQIRRRGKAEAEISSPWIQSKAMAQDIVDWMKENFSYGNDQISVTIFGNPLIEIADVVHVNYPDKYIDGDYFVVAVRNSFSDGIETTLTLRRRI
jgi:hypothetical protein